LELARRNVIRSPSSAQADHNATARGLPELVLPLPVDATGLKLVEFVRTNMKRPGQPPSLVIGASVSGVTGPIASFLTGEFLGLRVDT
jgi:hypothetical protein